MDCQQYQEDLTAYMDGELAPSRASEIKSHVEQCRPCADELESLRGSALFLEGKVRELDVDARLWRNVRARISLEGPTARPSLLQLLFGRRLAAGAVALAAVLAVAFGVWTYRERQADEQGLRQYMNEYVHTREMQEIQETRRPYHGAPGVEYPAYMDNPFVTVRPVSLDNPFRSEAR